MIFTHRYRYRFGDIDHAGIAYYPTLLHYFHCGFEDWWSEGLGVPYPTVMREHNLGLPAVKLDAEFYSPIRYGDEPVFHLGVLRIGNSSVEFGYWFARQEGGVPLCRARVITAAVDMDTMQKRAFPDEWRQRFQPFVIGEDEFPKGR